MTAAWDQPLPHRRHRPRGIYLERRAFARVLEDAAAAEEFTRTALVWLETRWAGEAIRRRYLEYRHRSLYLIFQFMSVGGAVSLPTLITLGGSHPGVKNAALWLSFAVALATVIERVFRFGPRWRLYRVGADQLGREGWAYLLKLAPYDDSQDPQESSEQRFRRFQARVEEMIGDFNSSYLTYATPTFSQVPNAAIQHADGPELDRGPA